LDFYLL